MEVSNGIVERQSGKKNGSIPVKKLIKFSLFLLYALGGGAAFAQSAQIPEDMLELDRQRCENDCVPAYGEITCKPLCSCTVGEFKKRLDFDAYLDLSVQLSRGDISPKNRKLLDDIALFCTAQLERDGIIVGGPTEAQGAPQTP